jgi:glycosyltransferase involved in cell wall biosynthesis
MSVANKILIVLPALAYGGTEKVIAQLIRVCVQDNYQVTMYIISGVIENKQAVPKDVMLILGRRARNVKQWILNTRRVRQLMKRHDIILAGCEKRPVYLIAAYSLFLKKLKLAFVHSIYPVRLMQHSLKHRCLMPAAYGQFDKIICVSTSLTQLLECAGIVPSDRLCTVYPGMDIQAIIKKAAEPLKSGDVQPIWFSQPYILTVTRIAREKRLCDLIQAFAAASQKISHQLVICGLITDEKYFNELKTLIMQLDLEKKVTFPGFFHNPYPLFLNSSLFVLTSEREGFSLVLAEALILNCNIVSTHCPVGPAEITANGRFGKLVPVGDIQAIKNAILVQLGKNTDTFSYDALQRHLSQFTHQAFATKIMALLKQTTLIQ